jgi:hypothetical protein
MVWKAGESGNPAGVYNRHRALKARLDGMTMKAAAVLEDVMANGSNSERLTAAKEVLDRSLGKAKQMAAVQVQHSSDAHLQALIALAAATQTQVEHRQPIDITPVRVNETHSLGDE